MATIFKGFSTVDKIRAPYSLQDTELVKRDLLNEFYTRKGERAMRPEFGCIAHDILMNPEDSFTLEELRSDIERIIDKDPRVTLINIDLYTTDHTIRADVRLQYVVLETDDTLYLEFIRENQ